MTPEAVSFGEERDGEAESGEGTEFWLLWDVGRRMSERAVPEMGWDGLGAAGGRRWLGSGRGGSDCLDRSRWA